MVKTKIEPPARRVCNKCKIDKSIEQYGNSSRHKDGKRRVCLECERAQSRAHYHANKEKRLATLHKWREENREYHNAYIRNRRVNDPDFVFMGDSLTDASGKVIKRSRKFKPIDKEEVNRKARERLPRYRSHMREYTRTKRKTDPKFRLIENMRSRMRTIMKRVKTNKCDGSKALIGCSESELKVWIERHWEPGMSWDNYGIGLDTWSIDHHFPCASFDLFQESEQRKCFHYTNLYPMWHVQNCSKQDMIPSSPKTPEQEAFLKSHEQTPIHQTV